MFCKQFRWLLLFHTILFLIITIFNRYFVHSSPIRQFFSTMFFEFSFSGYLSGWLSRVAAVNAPGHRFNSLGWRYVTPQSRNPWEDRSLLTKYFVYKIRTNYTWIYLNYLNTLLFKVCLNPVMVFIFFVLFCFN